MPTPSEHEAHLTRICPHCDDHGWVRSNSPPIVPIRVRCRHPGVRTVVDAAMKKLVDTDVAGREHALQQRLWGCMSEAIGLATELENSGVAVAALGLAGAYRDLHGSRMPQAEETELDALRAILTVLAAAWASNANHDPHPSTACAWRSASEALDKLLETP